MLGRFLRGLLGREGPERAPSAAAPDPEALARAGWDALRRGELEEARQLARDAIAVGGDVLSAYHVLAHAELRGEHYLGLLARIHALVRPRTYLEIGVAQGDSLRLCRPETRAVGIDPEPEIEEPLPPNVSLFAETSDSFFAQRDLVAELGGRRVELAFIDGLHLFEFALRDFINVERHCEPGGAILLHDCYPLDELTAARERCTHYWTGDVWRTVVALRAYRPDLSVCTLAAPPSGLALVRNLDPGSTLLAERFDAIVADLAARGYAGIAARRAEALHLVPADWPSVAALLAPGAARLTQ
jgi:hypothetical protein